MFKRLYPFWRPAWRATAIGLGLLVLAGAMELLQPWPVKWLVDHVLGSRPAPAWAAKFWPASKTAAVAWLAGAIVALALAQRLTQMLSQLLLIRAGVRLVRELRCRVCDQLHHLSLRYHDTHKVGDSVYRALYDSYAAQSLLSQALSPVLTGAILLVGILVVMLRMDPMLTLVALAVLPLFWLISRRFGRSIERHSAKYHTHEGGLYGQVLESLSLIRLVQAFAGEKIIARRFAQAADQSVRLNQRLSAVQLAFSTAIGLAMACGTAAVVYWGALRVLQGRMTIGDILVFLAYLGMLYTPVSGFTQSVGVYRSVRTQLSRVFEILDTAPEIADRPDAIAPPYARALGRIEFRGVSFAYDVDREVLRGIDAVVEPGTVVAIVGRTGAGKSTLASLLLRLYDPTEGQILLDGQDMRKLRLSWLRGQMAVVLQDALLFSGTIEENIAFGQSSATREQIKRAAGFAQIDDYIRSLPDGYQTMLGERGVNLSGGQRQRISIARAFLRDATILLLDEPTSALDAHTESTLVDCLNTLKTGRTTFIIAHRLSTIRLADEIWVMDDGRIVERGSHAKLMAQDTRYRRMHQRQHATGADSIPLDDVLPAGPEPVAEH